MPPVNTRIFYVWRAVVDTHYFTQKKRAASKRSTTKSAKSRAKKLKEPFTPASEDTTLVSNTNGEDSGPRKRRKVDSSNGGKVQGQYALSESPSDQHSDSSEVQTSTVESDTSGTQAEVSSKSAEVSQAGMTSIVIGLITSRSLRLIHPRPLTLI